MRGEGVEVVVVEEVVGKEEDPMAQSPDVDVLMSSSFECPDLR